MKLLTKQMPALRLRARCARAFTMVEIAIAMAVIAFALVAIVGLLPLGMETQRDNRQETIVNQDGIYLMEELRGAAPYNPELTNFIDRVSVNGAPRAINSSADFLKAMCTVNSTNLAIMRSISGAVSTRSPAVQDFAMHYLLVSQLLPASADPAAPSVDTAPAYAVDLARNLFEVRLAFYWPVRPDWRAFLAGTPGAGVNELLPDGARRQVFRTVLSGQMDSNGFLNTSFFVKP